MHSFVYMFITAQHGAGTVSYAGLESSVSVCTVWIRINDLSIAALAVCLYTESYENITFEGLCSNVRFSREVVFTK